ncbi:hypothetical protein JCM8097_008152 [Rhodosporidiobolus ruineniae]
MSSSNRNGPGDRKRAAAADFLDGDANGGPPSPAKRPKGNGPAAPSFKPTPISASLPPRPNLPSAASSSNPAIDIAAKRAEIQAKLAAMKANGGLPPAPPAAARPPPPPSAGLPARPVAVAAPGATPAGVDPELAKKIAEAKRKVAEMAARKQAEEQAKANPYLSSSFQGTKKDPMSVDPSIAGRGGLAMAAHPLLLDTAAPSAQSKKDRYKPMAPKFSTTKANARMPAPSPRPPTPVASTSDAAPESLKESAFYDPRLGFGSAGVTGKSHMGKGHVRSTFSFKQPGTFVKKGEAMRAEARMEDLKRRILESSQKAGVLSDLEETAKKVRRPPPPDIEWWDEGYLPEKDYASQSGEFLDKSPLITHLVQHPISIPAPQDKNHVEIKPLFLTKKELKKKRRMRRQAEMQDKRDRQKMGLLPPDPPKVKISNMMRVLTQDAIADPTKVEAQVRREMVARERKHVKDNAARALTEEEKREKRENEYAKDEAKGIQAMAFKVRYLSDPSHKFKVKKNAVDLHLTGVICHNKQFCLVLVEGGAKSIKKYKQLMLNRIRWTEAAAPRNNADSGPVVEMVDGIPRPTAPFAKPEHDDEAPESLDGNYCREVFEGALRERLFPDIRHANCPTDTHAREALGKQFAYLWDVAKADKGDEYDL